MTRANAVEDWPEGFLSDAACALSAIEAIQEAAPALHEAPLSPAAQDRMRRVLDVRELTRANAAAVRIVRNKNVLERGI